MQFSALQELDIRVQATPTVIALLPTKPIIFTVGGENWNLLPKVGQTLVKETLICKLCFQGEKKAGKERFYIF